MGKSKWKGKFKGKKFNPKAALAPASASKIHKPYEMKCYFCRKPGHIKKDCTGFKACVSTESLNPVQSLPLTSVLPAIELQPQPPQLEIIEPAPQIDIAEPNLAVPEPLLPQNENHNQPQPLRRSVRTRRPTIDQNDYVVYLQEPDLILEKMTILFPISKPLRASRQWYKKFDSVITSFGFTENLVDECVYMKTVGKNFIFLILYVDDILLASSDLNLLNVTKAFLSKNFDMKDLGEASFVLGIEIKRDRKKGLLGLSQQSYINKVLTRFDMQKCAPGEVPVSKGDKLHKGQCPRTDLERESMKTRPYARLVGSLMRVENLDVVGYTDSDFAGHYPDSSKSTSGYIYMMAGGAIAWRSVKQTLTTTSTMQAEFIAVYEGVCQGLWLRNFLIQTRLLDSISSRPLRVYCDNSAAVCFTRITRGLPIQKHIDLKYYSVRERVKHKEIEVVQVDTLSQLADPFTKALSVVAFKKHIADMGILPTLDA
ncbi:hypothetical protein M0R45_020078 [Rubus argutus]|uniref:CCHC-type domain-containing protein n=1 Tax=Rubus argutus TaxID=59490 RepID=A0AAW1X9D1_RUBAR